MTWICVVDDEPDVCDVLTEALRGAGYGARSFRDGSDALEAIEKALEPPRLVILDVLLARMSGREVLRLLRIGRRVPEVPVLVVTGMDVDNAYFAPWPILGVLRKPIALDELLATVARAVPLPRKRR